MDAFVAALDADTLQHNAAVPHANTIVCICGRTEGQTCSRSVSIACMYVSTAASASHMHIQGYAVLLPSASSHFYSKLHQKERCIYRRSIACAKTKTDALVQSGYEHWHIRACPASDNMSHVCLHTSCIAPHHIHACTFTHMILATHSPWPCKRRVQFERHTASSLCTCTPPPSSEHFAAVNCADF